ASAMAELMPAFVMPNDPAVDRILKAASETLRRAGKPSELDGYRSKDLRNMRTGLFFVSRVRRLTDAGI
ncbi:MAG: hypothetical protein ACXWK7_08990, partial [Caulobacteraceae bacterium]